MAVIRANRASIDDRFSVLGFTVRTDYPLFEVGLATDPDLLKAENRSRRTAHNFFSSRLLAAPAPAGREPRAGRESIYLVPPNVVARFVGQPRLYFGLATYRDGDRSHPISVKVPDAGNMYVSLSGLTGRGLRRTAHADGSNGYGGNGQALVWGGDALVTGEGGPAGGVATPARNGNGSRVNGNGSGNGNGAAVSAEPAPYSDGYSDDLWEQGQTGATGGGSVDRTSAGANGGNGANGQATHAAVNGHAANGAPTPATGANGDTAPPLAAAQELLLDPHYRSGDTATALLDQLRFFAESVNWFVGVSDTGGFPHSAICAVRRPTSGGDTEHGTAFYIGRNLLLTAAHVVEGRSELIIVPGKKGAGTGNEPFGRFRVRSSDWSVHPSRQAGSSNFDIAIIKVSKAAPNDRWFDLIEELRESRPEGVVVTGYSVQSRGGDTIHRIINRTIDGAKQHAHGGHVRTVDDEVFGYDVQTLAGASGSPVYWIESNGTPQAHLVGVHVAGDSASTNRGCRLTDAKIAWIRQRATTWGQANAMALGRGGGSLARHPNQPLARPLLVSSYYQPTGWLDALRTQIGFFVSSAMWFLGVSDTTVPPHSAICQVRRPDGSAEGALHGSAFFIAPGLLMTAAHVVDGQSELIIVPGKNGGGTGTSTEPLGRFRVSSSSFRKHPSYASGNSDFDIALIKVPSQHAAATGQFFDLVEELTQSRPEGVVVCGYAARWYADDVIEHWVNANIDPNKQHMHGGYIRSLPSDETFDYDLQTLGGSSGAPVYWIEDAAVPRAHLVGVHVAAHSETTNLGCRITPDKLAWIRSTASSWGKALSFSLAIRSRALGIDPGSDEDSLHGIEGPIPDDLATAQGMAARARSLAAPTPEYPQASRFVPADRSNYRATSGGRSIERVVIHITDGGANINGTIGWFQNPSANVSAHYVIGQDGEVVQMVRHDDVAWHARSANGTSIGIEHVANTRGLNPTPAQMCASAALVTWLCDQYGIAEDRTHILGHSEADTSTTHTGCPNAVWDWNYYMGMVSTRTCYEPPGAGQTRAQAIPLDPGVGGQSIHPDALSVGDIIVSTARHAVSYAIRAGTLSAISHAMLYVGDNRVIEAVGDGVREVPLETAVGDAILAVAYHDPRVDAAKAQQLVAFARAQVGRPYNYTGVARSGYRILYPVRSRVIDALRDLAGVDDTDARSFYCSELVFAAFDAAGIPLVAQRADASTPDDLVQLARGNLEYVGHLKARDELLGIALGVYRPRSRALSAEASNHEVELIPQPDKNSCWAAAMAMLLSFRRQMSVSPETLANEVGTSLTTSYDWGLLEAVRDRYGFVVIEQPSNASLYHSPRQWAEWLQAHGPLWVVIVGAPHAVVVAGIRGNLDDPKAAEVRVLNPWDTRVPFDADPVVFNPPNAGYEDWLSFDVFSSDFGNMAEPDYGNWRVLHLPEAVLPEAGAEAEAAATAQSLGMRRRKRLAPPPARVRALQDDGTAPTTGTTGNGEQREAIEPSRIPGTRMSVLRGHAGNSTWALEQVEGMKTPATPPAEGSSTEPTDVRIELGEWPALEGEPAPLPLTVSFRAAQGGVGDVRIATGTPTPAPAAAGPESESMAHNGYGVDVMARIDDAPDADAVSTLKVGIDYRFNGLAEGSPTARIEMRLYGDGRYERENRWVTTA